MRRQDWLRALLAIGKIQDPSFKGDKYVEELLELSAKAWHRCSQHKKDVIYKAQCINQILFKDFKVEGKTERYKQVIDDPARYYLHKVMDSKQGCPLSVTALYSVIADQIGLDCEVYALPNYYLLKVEDPAAGTFYIDAFDHGKFLKPEEFHRKFRVSLERNRMMSTNLFENISGNHLVARVVQQLKHVYILKGDALAALRAVEVLSALYPQSPEITRDRGILYCEMEYFSKAIEDLKFYVEQRPHAEDVGEIKKLTNMLRGYREIMN